MDDLESRLMSGIDIPYPKLQILIRQPLVREISMMGESHFFSGTSILCLTKKKFEEDTAIAEMPTFNIVLKVLAETKDSDKRNDFNNLMSLLFPDYKIMITQNSIILNKPEEKFIAMIDVNNFEEIQGIIKKILGVKETDNYGGYNPASPMAQRIAEKMAAARAKINAQKVDSDKSQLARYISVLSVGLKKLPEEITSMTLYQFYSIVERFYSKIAWDIDFKVRLAGGKPKDEPKDWLS